MTEENKQLIKEIFCDEREYGQEIFDLKDRIENLRIMAELLCFRHKYKDHSISFTDPYQEKEVNECLDYYFLLKNG